MEILGLESDLVPRQGQHGGRSWRGCCWVCVCVPRLPRVSACIHARAGNVQGHGARRWHSRSSNVSRAVVIPQHTPKVPALLDVLGHTPWQAASSLPAQAQSTALVCSTGWEERCIPETGSASVCLCWAGVWTLFGTFLPACSHAPRRALASAFSIVQGMARKGWRQCPVQTLPLHRPWGWGWLGFGRERVSHCRRKSCCDACVLWANEPGLLFLNSVSQRELIKLLILLVCWGEWPWQVGFALIGREA